MISVKVALRKEEILSRPVAAKEEDPMFGSKESWPTTAGFREEIPMNRFGMSMSGWKVEDLKSRCVE